MKNTFFFLLVTLGITSCSKTTYNTLPGAAYLRVFNSLNFAPDIYIKDLPTPFLTMIIDPEYDKTGLVKGGKIIGDFLDKRAPYAPPYPANAGSTDFKNTEYPGIENVLVGPVVNGFNLSSWAQVPPGKHRMVFFSRPINSTPFFSLDAQYRQTVVADSTVDLTSGEVYTMEVLHRTVSTTESTPTQLYIRQEEITKRAFNDTTLYVNFYNLSAEGYAAAHPGIMDVGAYYFPTNSTRPFGDTMNLYYNLFTGDMAYPWTKGAPVGQDLIPGYNNVWLGTVVRSQTSGRAPYYALPMFAAPDTTGGILSSEWQVFILTAPGRSPIPGPVPDGEPGGMSNADPTIGAIGCSNLANDGKYSEDLPPFDQSVSSFLCSTWLPSLIRNTATGTYTQRSFATVSTIEIINGYVYLMSIQRTYPPPVR